ncbi:MAG TPA: DHA2 family efflux MFS transporter permease subunit [Rhizomicrobium sp.]|nr:DHA2 family efflux MFS transporter permease subunit [Rhizomicrobium sp.]
MQRRQANVKPAMDRRTTPTMEGPGLAAAIFVLSLATFISILDTTIVNVAIPHIAGAFAASPNEGTWAITSYAVAEAFTVPLSGWLAARFGVVRMFLFSIAGFALFSTLCGLAPSLQVLVAFRVLQGLAGGPLMPMAQTLILRVAPPKRVEMAMGLWMMTTILAPIAGPVLGGMFADGIGWRWAFYINVPVCLVCGLWAWRLLRSRETQVTKQPVDFIGMGLLALWVGALQIMLDNGEDRDWFSSSWIIALFAASVIGFVVFLIWELTDRHPVVDLRVFRHRTFAVSAAAMTLTFGAFFGAIILLPLWLQMNLGYTATLSGYILSLQGILGILVAPIAASLMSRIDPRAMMSLGLSILAGVIFWRTTFALNIAFSQMILPQLAMGLGIPLFFVPLMTLSMAAVKAGETASASGLINFLRTIAGAIATALVVSAWNSDIRASRVDLVGALARPQDILARLERTGQSPGQALHTFDAMVQQQSVMLATNHMSLILAVIIAIAAVGVWLMPRPAQPAKVYLAH